MTGAVCQAETSKASIPGTNCLEYHHGGTSGPGSCHAPTLLWCYLRHSDRYSAKAALRGPTGCRAPKKKQKNVVVGESCCLVEGEGEGSARETQRENSSRKKKRLLPEMLVQYIVAVQPTRQRTTRGEGHLKGRMSRPSGALLVRRGYLTWPYSARRHREGKRETYRVYPPTNLIGEKTTKQYHTTIVPCPTQERDQAEQSINRPKIINEHPDHTSGPPTHPPKTTTKTQPTTQRCCCIPR